MKHLLVILGISLFFAGCAEESGEELCVEAAQRMMLCGSGLVMGQCDPALASQITSMSCDMIETMGGKADGTFEYIERDGLIKFKVKPKTITPLGNDFSTGLAKELQGLYLYVGRYNEDSAPVVIFDGSSLPPQYLNTETVMMLPDLLAVLDHDNQGRSRVVSMQRLSRNREWASFTYAGQMYSVGLDRTGDKPDAEGAIKKFTPEAHKSFGMPVVKGILDSHDVVAFWHNDNLYNLEPMNYMHDAKQADGRFSASIRQCGNLPTKELCFVGHERDHLGRQSEVHSIWKTSNAPKWRVSGWVERVGDFTIVFWAGIMGDLNFEIFGPAGAMNYPKVVTATPETAPPVPEQTYDCPADCVSGCVAGVCQDVYIQPPVAQEPAPTGPPISGLCPPPADQPGLTGCPLSTHDCVGVVRDMKNTKYDLTCILRNSAAPNDCSYLMAEKGVAAEMLGSYFRQCIPDGNGCAGWQFCMRPGLRGMSLTSPEWSPQCDDIDDSVALPKGKNYAKTIQAWFAHYLKPRTKTQLFTCEKATEQAPAAQTSDYWNVP